MMRKYTVLSGLSSDRRLQVDRHTDKVFPITRFTSREQVESRREALRFNLQMAAGLYPWPDKTPLNPRYETVGEYDGYTVKKVMFESRPGFWSTGNLYLPRPLQGKHPAIFNVVGHWEAQRLTRIDDDQSPAADYPQQLANFARMGFVCLITDMIGKVDSRQITHDYGRDEKETWLSNGLGVQLWNNIRGMDLLCAMPEVDPERIGVTGASGGGSQTLFLALADDRVKAAAPINMISLQMQGGCQCENAPGLRRDTDNTEMCALLAPRPLFLSGSTGDWTRDLETVEYPAVLEGYRQYGAEDAVEYFFQDADHQYNSKTRSRVYGFFARHLLGQDPGWQEQPIETGDILDLTWFRGQGKAPGAENDGAFFAAVKAERAQKVGAMCACEKKRMLGWMTGVTDVEPETKTVCARDGVETGILTGKGGEEIPWVRIVPENWDQKRVCLALFEAGKAGVEDEAVQKLLSEGVAVVSGDLFLTGEYAGAVREIPQGNPRRYFTTFNYTDDALRCQDAALLWKLARETGEEHFLFARGDAARCAACVLPLLEGVQSARLQGEALEIDTDEAYFETFFIPGLQQLGGLKGCLQLAGCPVERF